MTQKITAQAIMDELQAHSDQLHALGINRIGLFGSYRRNNDNSRSDIDFLVDFEHISFDAYMETKFILEELFKCKVDLVIEKNIKPRLRNQIESEVIYAPRL